jgi:hypothetical protein
MGLSWEALDIDAHDPQRIASFWEAALGWRRTHDSADEVVIEPPEGSAASGVAPEILFLRVPEDKVVKNRLHIDLRPDSDQAARQAGRRDDECGPRRRGGDSQAARSLASTTKAHPRPAESQTEAS